jgi:hypothetical protein
MTGAARHWKRSGIVTIPGSLGITGGEKSDLIQYLLSLTVGPDQSREKRKKIFEADDSSSSPTRPKACRFDVSFWQSEPRVIRGTSPGAAWLVPLFLQFLSRRGSSGTTPRRFRIDVWADPTRL